MLCTYNSYILFDLLQLMLFTLNNGHSMVPLHEYRNNELNKCESNSRTLTSA